MYRLKVICFSEESDDADLDMTEETEIVHEHDLYTNLKPSPTKTHMALKIGEPTMFLRTPGETEWKSYRYTTERWWITDVNDFDGKLYAVTSENGIAVVDLDSSVKDVDVALIETAGSFDDRDFDGQVMTCHLFDAETDVDTDDYEIYVLKLVVKGGDIVDFVKW